MMDEKKIDSLAYLLADESTLKQKIEILRKEFDESNFELFQKYAKIRQKIIDEKTEISVDAILEFDQTGEKKLYGGVGIRVMTKFVYDENTAFDWAKEHSLCLKLDSKAFDKIAKTQEISFVKKEEKITATFPSEIKTEKKEEVVK